MGVRWVYVMWLLLVLAWPTFATNCVDIWPAAATQYSTVSYPPALLYSPPSPTAVTSLNRSFSSGDYTMSSYSSPNNIVLTTSGATTRIFVNGSLTINNNALLNAGGSPENLLIVVTGSLTISNNATIRGFILVGGSAFLSNNAFITGGVTAVGGIAGWNNSGIAYAESAVNRLQGGVVCDAQTVEVIDHFEFVHAGNALTCNPQSITLKACKNASCSQLVTSSVTSTLQPSSGWSGSGVSGNTVTFTGGSSSLSLAQRTPTTVTLGATGAVNATSCQIGSSLSTANCAVTFADSGFVVDVPTKLANKTATGILLKAVKTGGSQQCVPAFASVSRNVKFWSTLVSPASYPGTAPSVSVNTASIGTSSATATTLNLPFNSQGEATLDVNYSDAGQLQLNVVYNGAAATGDAGLTMSGSDLFVSQPAGFCLTTAQTCPISASDAAYASCALFRRAGESFPVTLQAKAWETDNDSSFCTGNSTTKNFISNAMTLQFSRLAPQVGNNGTLSAQQFNFTSADQGQTQLSTSYNEVGVIRLSALANATYEGTTLPATGLQELATGRIGPYQFTKDSALLTPACGQFSYLEQPFTATAMFSARSANGAVLTNYQGVFAKASMQVVANNGATNLSSRISYSSTQWAAWNAGQLQVTDAVKVLRTTLPDGPFDSTLIGVTLSANDVAGSGSAEPVLTGLTMDPATNGACTSCTAWQLGSTQQFRYGRMRILEVFGSELSGLPVQLLAEYYNGSQFVSHSLDNCSAVVPSRLTATGAVALSVSGQSGVLQTGISGATSLMLSAPQQPGLWQLTYDLASAPWLQYDWQPGQGALLENPTAQAAFGVFRGQNRQIYWREQ